jgi:phasin family protein
MPVDFTKIFESMQKIADLNIAKIEAAVEAQKAATQSLVELTEARVKAVSEIKDYDGFAAFVKDQSELTKSSVEQMIEDSKGAVEDAQSYGEEVKKILSEVTEVAAPVAAPVAKKAAAKPAAKKAA